MSANRVASTPVVHTFSVDPAVVPLSSSLNVGGVPFCFSGGLGTILCYPASFLKSAYNFPASTGAGALNGTGSTIVIVDAFGSPTAQSDLNTYDTTFGIPAINITILCGPTWTGLSTDHCPVTSLGDITTVGQTYAGEQCGGPGGVAGWGEETTLDLSQAHSLAPGANIVLVVANDCFDSSIYAAEMAVVSQSKYAGSIMSQSFGEPDDLVTCTAVNAAGACTNYDNSLLNNCSAPSSVNIGCPNIVFQKAETNHWTVIASSGDCGANTDACVLGTLELTPSFPSTSPLVLAAGGTQGNPYGGQYTTTLGPGVTFNCPANTVCNTGLVMINGGPNGCGTAARPGNVSSCVPVGYGGEQTWNELTPFGPGTQSGGGISILYKQPSYQASSMNRGTTLLDVPFKVNGRSTPDVSFNSAINGGVLAWLGFINSNGSICTAAASCTGDWAVFGGTSASSPAWAAIVALLNQAHGSPVGFLNPAVYKLGQTQQSAHFTGAFHDITLGTNAICSGLCGEDGYLAGPGYDLTTGWGTPNVSVFIQDILTFIH